ncbi:hypothetical protein D918_06917 [Trichuris suis]|nr:hypothetical protein D918_06917 [Trichuris suis]
MFVHTFAHSFTSRFTRTFCQRSGRYNVTRWVRFPQ